MCTLGGEGQFGESLWESQEASCAMLAQNDTFIRWYAANLKHWQLCIPLVFNTYLIFPGLMLKNGFYPGTFFVRTAKK